MHDCLGWVVGNWGGGGAHQAIFAFVVWLKVDDEILSNAHLYEVSSHCFSLTLAVRCYHSPGWDSQYLLGLNSSLQKAIL